MTFPFCQKAAVAFPPSLSGQFRVSTQHHTFQSFPFKVNNIGTRSDYNKQDNFFPGKKENVPLFRLHSNCVPRVSPVLDIVFSDTSNHTCSVLCKRPVDECHLFSILFVFNLTHCKHSTSTQMPPPKSKGKKRPNLLLKTCVHQIH